MQDVITFYAKTINSLARNAKYCYVPLEQISVENGTFAYIDDRKNYSENLIESLKVELLSDDFVDYLLFKSPPIKIKPVLQLFPTGFQKKKWDDIFKEKQTYSEIQKGKFFQQIRKSFIKILKSKDQKVKNDILSSLMGFTFLSKTDNFPDFLFPVSSANGVLQDGSFFELKDSKGGNISSFNSTIPTQWKTLDEITKLNSNDIVTKLTSLIDYPHSFEQNYLNLKRRCFYFARTNNANDNIRISLIEGSFFETLPKTNLIGETIKAIAKDHLGGELTPELENIFARISDQSLIAKSRGDLRTMIDGIEKRASVSPRFRIMSEVTTDGNPHTYSEIPPQTFNLVLQVSTTRDKGVNYRNRRAELISLMSANLERVNGTGVKMSNDELICNNISVLVKEIAHNRNGLHLVFQYDFSRNN